ncbi:hypothetical protein, partial [Streptomyces capuensis]|uniref:hypothetical protein n=1 Tax=Streptomyces capuensis TaxID=1464056 RepID=UPI003AF07558
VVRRVAEVVAGRRGWWGFVGWWEFVGWVRMVVSVLGRGGGEVATRLEVGPVEERVGGRCGGGAVGRRRAVEGR